MLLPNEEIAHSTQPSKRSILFHSANILILKTKLCILYIANGWTDCIYEHEFLTLHFMNIVVIKKEPLIKTLTCRNNYIRID